MKLEYLALGFVLILVMFLADSTGVFPARMHLNELGEGIRLEGLKSRHHLRHDDENWDAFETQNNTKSDKNCHPHWNAEQGYIRKSVFNEKLRYIFVLGLEGSGHHFMKPVLASCDRYICPDFAAGFHLSMNGMNHGLFGAKSSVVEVRSQLLLLRQGLARHQKHDKEGVIFMNTVCGAYDPSELSYPNYASGCREFKYPDATILANVLEDENSDFRILLLLRDLFEIMVSTTIHRHFQTWDEGLEIYEKMVSRIEAQLSLLDPRFIACLDYDELPKVPQNLGSFLGVDSDIFNLSSTSGKIFHSTSNKGWRHKVDKLNVMARTYQPKFKQLSRRVRKLRLYCPVI